MNKTFNFLVLATAVVAAFVSCSKEIDNPSAVDNGIEMKTITVKTSIDTKTTLDANHENIVWAENDKISIFNDIDDDNAEVDYVANGDITVSVPAATNEIYAHYPYYSGNTSGPESVSVYIANSQTQKNPGELNGYHFPMVAKGTVSSDNKAIISLYPVAGALALNIYHTGLSGEENVKSVKVTPSSSNKLFAGSQSTNLTGDSIVYSSAGNSNPVTVSLTNYLALGNTKPTNKQTFAGQIYVCLAKQSYASVKFEIETDKGTYTITSNSTPFDLVNNDFVPVNINLNSANFEAIATAVDPTAFSWTLVKDDLAIGDKVVIAAAESAYAMSTTQNNNNRGQIAVTKSSNALTAVADVQVFEVVAGSESNTFAFKCRNGAQLGKYIAAASSSNNNMHSNSSIDDNASWSVSIDNTDGVASVVAQGSYTRNTLKYNPGNSIFSCYASSNSMADVVFYRAGLPSAGLSFPQASYSANLGEQFTAPTLTNPYSVSVTYSSSDTGVATVDESTGAITLVDAGTTTITASFAGNSSYVATDASYELTVVDTNVEQWVKTAITDIAATDVFVIVGGGYAVTNDNSASSGAPSAVSVTVANNALTAVPAANLQWKLTGNATDGYSFSPASDASMYLICNTTSSSSNNNNIRVGTGNRNVWEFDNNGIMKTKDNYTARYFSLYTTTPDWRGYVNTNSAVALDFYVKQGGSSTPTKTLESITVTPPTKTTYSVGDAFNAAGMVVTANYSDATTADVTSSATTNFATQVASAGNKTVTVSYTEGGVTKTGTFDITVNDNTSVVVFIAGTDKGSTTDTTADSITKNGVTISCTSAALGRTDNYRFYSGSTTTISISSGTITKVEFTNVDGYSQGLLSVPSNGVGSYSDGIWTGSAPSLTLKASGQYRATIIKVTYE